MIETRRTVLLLATILLIAAPVAGQSTSIFVSEDHLWVVGDLQVAPVADTFALMRVNRFPDLRLGVALTYAGPLVRNMDLSLYVYPTREGDDDPVQQEFDRALQDIHTYAERREAWEVEVKHVGPQSLETSTGTVLDGFFAEAEYTVGEDKRASLLHLFVKDGLILKYRISHSPEDAETLAPHLDAWLRITAEKTSRYPG